MVNGSDMTAMNRIANVAQHFAALPQNGKVLAEYVWLGGAETVMGGFDMRSKTKTLDKMPTKVEDLPVWNYDGSSTNQAPGDDSEVLLIPVAMYPDPFRQGNNVMVLCETANINSKPIPTNSRRAAKACFDANLGAKPWFGIEQEYTLFKEDKKTPLGCPEGGYPGPQGPYYCSAGLDNSFGRDVMDAHYKACVFAGLTISGTNAEVMPGQWEYQIGPCEGIDSGDHLWMSRYLMVRICEMFGAIVSFNPKPIPGDWNGAGCHTNFSTEEMRQPGGLKAIITAVEKLGKNHAEHVKVYGEGNERRLTGNHETAPID